MFIHLVLVGIGGFAGAISRFALSKSLNKASYSLPIGTLIVNLLGSFLLGIITGAKSDEMIALLFGTGFMGAFTTFSTLKLEMIQIHLKKYRRDFILYTTVTYAGGISLAFLGYEIGNRFL
ncbi:fluoride efflux transporter FluC [Pseudalkalibacillus caeni]|uniref:Fluoride-specific ion channel FluC n=1 Tax=Exobacillus caeni TaxID=2574798 RepID=A0A5R9F0L5_9BACL|nr:CrcB family protein [Pseudalkalibacillus caeni]TLS37087.1 fluoride efflux transporter CrcB [Pseudalkalibacillus caeni]